VCVCVCGVYMRCLASIDKGNGWDVYMSFTNHQNAAVVCCLASIEKKIGWDVMCM